MFEAIIVSTARTPIVKVGHGSRTHDLVQIGRQPS